MSLTGLKAGQQVAWCGHIWTVWAQAPGARQWHLYRHPDVYEAPTGFTEASAYDLFPPTPEGIAESLKRPVG